MGQKRKIRRKEEMGNIENNMKKIRKIRRKRTKRIEWKKGLGE